MYVILYMYVIASTFLVLYHGVTENIYSSYFIHARISDSFTTIVLKTFVTESAAYMFMCLLFVIYICEIYKMLIMSEVCLILT